jgi:hypothetical protein
MRTRTKIIICFAISMGLILHLSWLYWLFSCQGNTWGLITLPLFLLLSIAIGIAIYPMLRLRSSKKIAFILSSIFLLVIFLQLVAHPGQTSLFSRMSEYSAAFWAYPDSIHYEDLAFGNIQRKTAAMEKYDDILPERIIPIIISETQESKTIVKEKHFISYRNGNIEYSDNNVRIIDAGDETLLVINPDSLNEDNFLIDIKLSVILKGNSYWGKGVWDEHGIRHALLLREDFRNYELHGGAAQIFTLALRCFR